LWERARVRGVFQPKAPLTRRVAKTSPTKGEVKSDLCNNAPEKKVIIPIRLLIMYRKMSLIQSITQKKQE
jgi:hypothetical protein